MVAALAYDASNAETPMMSPRRTQAQNDARAMIHPAHAMLDEMEDELSRMTGYARLKILPLLARIRAVL